MCSAPVTFGGGLTIVKGVASGRDGRNSPRLSHSWAHFASIAAGSNVFSIGIMRRALPAMVRRGKGERVSFPFASSEVEMPIGVHDLGVSRLRSTRTGFGGSYFFKWLDRKRTRLNSSH